MSHAYTDVRVVKSKCHVMASTDSMTIDISPGDSRNQVNCVIKCDGTSQVTPWVHERYCPQGRRRPRRCLARCPPSLAVRSPHLAADSPVEPSSRFRYPTPPPYRQRLYNYYCRTQTTHGLRVIALYVLFSNLQRSLLATLRGPAPHGQPSTEPSSGHISSSTTLEPLRTHENDPYDYI